MRAHGDRKVRRPSPDDAPPRQRDGNTTHLGKLGPHEKGLDAGTGSMSESGESVGGGEVGDTGHLVELARWQLRRRGRLLREWAGHCKQQRGRERGRGGRDWGERGRQRGRGRWRMGGGGCSDARGASFSDALCVVYVVARRITRSSVVLKPLICSSAAHARLALKLP